MDIEGGQLSFGLEQYQAPFRESQSPKRSCRLNGGGPEGLGHKHAGLSPYAPRCYRCAVSRQWKRRPKRSPRCLRDAAKRPPSCRRAAIPHWPSQALSMTGTSRRQGAVSGSRRPFVTCSPGSEMHYCSVAVAVRGGMRRVIDAKACCSSASAVGTRSPVDRVRSTPGGVPE
jgi:hypothetical protein